MFPLRVCNYNVFKLQVKYFSNSCITFRSHYDSLEITPKATQSDIKSAYYKLSKLYHPDKNAGCLEASRKFQDISNAYEVLGNFKSRRLYDKGMLGSAGDYHQQEYPEHPESKFYKSRETRRTASGPEPIYDFDEWSRAHYGDTFQRAARAKKRWVNKQERAIQTNFDMKTERVMIVIFFSVFFGLWFSLTTEDLDKVKPVK